MTEKKLDHSDTGKGPPQLVGQAAMAISPTIEAQEAVVSSETAISCLALLGSQIGVDVETEKVRLRQRGRGGTLAISELIELANDFGFRAQYVHRDWSWLFLTVAIQPVVLLLKNGNTIVALGVGRTGAPEIVVSDPLHRGGALIILSRDSIERAWDGDAVTITPQLPIIEEISVQNRATATEIFRNRTGTEKFWKIFAIIILCLGSVSLVAALITLPLADKSAVSQTKAPPSPAADLPRTLAIAPATGPKDAADQTSTVRRPIDPAVYVAFGSIAAAAVPQLVEPTPQLSGLESSALAARAPAHAPIAEVSGEPNLPASSADWANSLGKDVPSQSVSAATGSVAAFGGSVPVGKGTGLVGGPKLSAADLVAILARGDEQLRVGDVASARLFYEHAADAGEANAALRLGETFDPIFLQQANLRGVSGDMEKALFWYARARDLGSDEANQLLKDLDQNWQADPKHF